MVTPTQGYQMFGFETLYYFIPLESRKPRNGMGIGGLCKPENAGDVYNTNNNITHIIQRENVLRYILGTSWHLKSPCHVYR